MLIHSSPPQSGMAVFPESSLIVNHFAACSHLREPLEEIGEGTSPLISLKCRACGCSVSPCLACCRPVRLQDSSDSTLKTTPTNKTGTEAAGLVLVTDTGTETATCDCCGVIFPGELERSLLGLPQKQALAAPTVRRIQEALFGRRAYFLSKQREQAFCREVLTKASDFFGPSTKSSPWKEAQEKERLECTILRRSDTYSFPSSYTHKAFDSLVSPLSLPLPARNNLQKESFPASSGSISLVNKRLFSATKRSVCEVTKTREEEQSPHKKQRLVLEKDLHDPVKKVKNAKQTEEDTADIPANGKGDREVSIADPANETMPNQLSPQITMQVNVSSDTKESKTKSKSSQQRTAETTSRKVAVDAKCARDSSAVFALQCSKTMVQDFKRPALELPIVCQFCPNNVVIEIQKSFLSSKDESMKAEEGETVAMRKLPIGSGHVATLRASYFWLETCTGSGVNGIRDLLKQVSEFVGERERLMKMARKVKLAEAATAMATADCEALKDRKNYERARGRERGRERGSHEVKQKTSSSLVAGILTGLMNDRADACKEAVKPYRAPHCNLLRDINVELKRILVRSRAIYMAEKGTSSNLEAIESFGLCFLGSSDAGEMEVLKTCFGLWLLIYHSVGHAIGTGK